MDVIDINFHNLNRHQILNKYVECLRQLRELAEQTRNMRALYFDNYILCQYFQQRRNVNEFVNSSNTESESFTMRATAGTYGQQIAFIKTELVKQLMDRRRKILYWLFYFLIAYLCILYKNETSSIVVRNMQTFIYPGMKMWRKMTLPVIKRFPGLTELYDESCLMLNPFFQVDDLNCDPCSNVQSVLDLSDENGETFVRRKGENMRKMPSEFVPFIFKINQEPIELGDLYDVYISNSETFRRDAYRVQSTSPDVTNLEELFHHFNHSHTNIRKLRNPTGFPSKSSYDQNVKQHKPQSHNLWRCNRMLPARLLRRLFTRPARLPSTGLALERFIAVDTPHAPSYTLPDTECANVYVQQTTGARFIILRPTTECRHRCHTLSVRLPQSFVLSYNWWYWKPISAPDPMSESLSISLVGSYC